MKVLFMILAPVGLALGLALQPAPAQAVLCFKTGEVRSGMNKICFYDCLGSTVAITVSSYQLCPLSIDR